MSRTPSLPQDIADPLALLWSEGALLAAGAAVASPWIDVTLHDTVRIIRTHAGGVYVLEVDWSRDGVTVDVTEVLTVANNASARVPIATRFVRFRVRNTDGTVAFTAHRTTVSAR